MYQIRLPTKVFVALWKKISSASYITKKYLFSWSGWPDLNRHEVALNGFSYYSMLPQPILRSLQSGLCLHHTCGHRVRWLVYSLYTFTTFYVDLARRCPKGMSAELASIHSESFLLWCSCAGLRFSSSPIFSIGMTIRTQQLKIF